MEILVRNKNTSTADAINATVTLAVPPYVAFASVAWTNFSDQPEVALRRHAILLSWPRLVIDEELHVRVLLTVDPNNTRGYGAGYAAATTPVFLTATMFQRYGATAAARVSRNGASVRSTVHSDWNSILT